MRNALPLNHNIITRADPFLSGPFKGCDPAGPLETRCPRCKTTMELVQPDQKRSEAILGVCTGCPAWYLIDMQKGTITDLGLSDRLSTPSLLAFPE